MHGSLLRVSLVACGICVGAVVGGGGAIWLRFGILGCGMAAVLSVVRRNPVSILAALALFGFACGAGAAAAQERSPVLRSLAVGVPECRGSGTVLDSLGGLGTAVALETLHCEGHEPVTTGGIAVADISAHAGSRFEASGWLIPLGDDHFDRARARAGAAAELAIIDIDVGRPAGLAALAAAVRDGLVEAGAALDPPEAALLRGLTIGDTQAISGSTLHEFRRAGLSHLLAVSGSNVSIVLGAVMLLGSRLPFRWRLCVGAAALGLFILVVGPDASVLRAAAMGAAGLVALAVGTRAEPLHVLALAVAVVVAIRPQIVFSVGLHLSVLATAGIIMLTPAILQFLRPLPRLVTLPLAVTIGAQFAVLPLLVIVFQEVSLVAPLANLVAAPAVAPATVLGLAGGAVAPVHAGLGSLLLRGAEPFVSWILFVGRTCAQPSWAATQASSSLGWALTLPLAAAFWWALRRQTGGLTSAT